MSRKLPITLLSLYRVQSNNLSYCIATQSADSLAFKKDRAPFEEEIMELIEELKSSAEFYETLIRPDKIRGVPIADGYEGQVEKTAQRLDELLSRNNNNGLRNRCAFFANNGATRLIQCIKIQSQFVVSPDLPSSARQTTIVRLKTLLGLFDTLYVGEVKMAAAVSQDESLIQLLFPLFTVEELFDVVLHALEDLLIARDTIFPLPKIGQFYKIVAKLDRKQLGQFSNMLALLIFEHNKEDFTDIFVKKEQLVLYPTFKQTTINQSIIVNIPELFPRLISLIESTIADLKQSDLFMNILAHQANQDLDADALLSTITNTEPISSHTSTYGGDVSIAHEKRVAKYLSQPRLVQALFNNYLYNTAELPRLDKSPLVGESVISEVLAKKRNGEEKKGGEEKKKQGEAPEPSNESTYAQYIYLIKINKNQVVEVLFVLSTLLSGKRKTELQRRFLKFDFINRMSGLYKQIKWQPFTIPNQTHIQTDAALKIQFLRLIHNLTSRDEWDLPGKLLFTSREEINTILYDEIRVFMMSYYIELGVGEDLEMKEFLGLISHPPMAIKSVYQELYTTGQPITQGNYLFFKKYPKMQDPGLLTQILRTYQEIPDLSANIRFWMSSFVESYLRSTYHILQLLVARSGIFKNIVHDIVTIEDKDNMNLQTSFDLLGEILKCNKRTLLLFESAISAAEYSIICGKIMSHIVDSNVFVRALIISFHKFDLEDKKYCKDKGIPCVPFSSKCSLLDFADKNRLVLLRSLILSVKPTTISQTNISCINTVIITLIFESSAGNLGKVLDGLRAEDLATHTGHLENLRELLLLWQDYYDFRPRDSLSLEYTTKIRFKLWISTVKDILKYCTDDMGPKKGKDAGGVAMRTEQ